jgi:hypothetical protein
MRPGRAANGTTRRHGRSRRAVVIRALLASGLVAGALPLAAEPVGAASAWTISASPSPFRPAHLTLSAVACATPSSCFAVGQRFDVNSSATGSVIERWNGTTWSTAVPLTQGGGELSGVSCPGTGTCMAVGTNYPRTIAKRWDGRNWKAVTMPKPPGSPGSLNGVDCATSTSCFAVGSYRSGSKIRALVEHWNGSAWTIVPIPRIGAANQMTLGGVSCPSTTTCFAVGNHEEPGDQVGGVLIEHWNGKTWTAQSAPTPSFAKQDGLPITPLLAGVSCTSLNSCMAVGYAPNRSLIERWNGRKWSIVTSPTFANGTLAELRAVSCASANDCSAVGTKLATIDEREGVPLRNSINEHWNGSSWKVVPKPGSVPTYTGPFEVGQLAELNGVSCPAKTSCAAVGDSAMTERWNGTAWSLAPLTATTSASALADVSCPAATTCLAVGSAAPFLDAGNQTLGERWDGTQWSVVPSVTPGGSNVYASLASVACAGPTDCTAVGGYTKHPTGGSSSSLGKALVEHWNGTKWSMVPSPSPSPKLSDATLRAVSCTSATDCNAVGDYRAYTNESPVQHLLAEHWNGSSWSIVPIPGPGAARLSGVSCTSATNCFAVGFTQTGHPLVDRWDGARWTAASSPAPPAGAVYELNDVSCIGDGDCTVVGEIGSNNMAVTKPLVERWNGTSWTVVPSPTPANRDQSRLNAVACTGAASCVAVGTLDGFRTTGHASPLVEEWNGSSWSEVAAAAVPGAGAGELSGVAAPTATEYVAVGYSRTSLSERTLVEQRS